MFTYNIIGMIFFCNLTHRFNVIKKVKQILKYRLLINILLKCHYIYEPLKCQYEYNF